MLFRLCDQSLGPAVSVFLALWPLEPTSSCALTVCQTEKGKYQTAFNLWLFSEGMTNRHDCLLLHSYITVSSPTHIHTNPGQEYHSSSTSCLSNQYLHRHIFYKHTNTSRDDMYQLPSLVSCWWLCRCLWSWMQIRE